MTTELGRKVPLDDWVSFHRDRILSVLFQMRQQGVPSPGFQLSMISGVTGLSEQQARQLAAQLLIEGFVVNEAGVYRLTDAGTRWVLASPTR